MVSFWCIIDSAWVTYSIVEVPTNQPEVQEDRSEAAGLLSMLHSSKKIDGINRFEEIG